MNIYLCLFAEYREFDADGGTSMDHGVIGSCWRNGTFGSVIGFLRNSAVVDYLHLCICINAYHIGTMMDQLKDDWECEDGVMVFSPIDDAMGFLFS